MRPSRSACATSPIERCAPTHGLPRSSAAGRVIPPLVLLVLSIVLAGCQVPFGEQRAPASAAGADPECVARCDLSKSQCEERQRVRERECAQQHLQIGPAPCTRARGQEPCLEPAACMGADLRLCAVQHQGCLLECGGPKVEPMGSVLDRTDAELDQAPDPIDPNSLNPTPLNPAPAGSTPPTGSTPANPDSASPGSANPAPTGPKP